MKIKSEEVAKSSHLKIFFQILTKTYLKRNLVFKQNCGEPFVCVSCLLANSEFNKKKYSQKQPFSVCLQKTCLRYLQKNKDYFNNVARQLY